MAKKDFAKLGMNLVEVASSQPSLRPPAAALSVVPAAPEPVPEPASPAAAEPAAPAASSAVAHFAPAAAPKPKAKAKTAPASEADALVQQAFALRGSLRKILRRKAAEADLTISGFILDALRAKGLPITDTDVSDGRKTRHG